MKAKAMIETNVAEAKVEAVDKVEVAFMDEVGIIVPTTTNRKGKAQHEAVEKAIQTRGMKNLKFNAIIVRSLGILLQNVELPTTELRRMPTMWRRRPMRKKLFF